MPESRTIIYNGYEFKINSDDMVSLTDIWKDFGRSANTWPSSWRYSTQGKKCINRIAKSLNVDESKVLQSFPYGGRQTIAHYEIACAYIDYLCSLPPSNHKKKILRKAKTLKFRETIIRIKPDRLISLSDLWKANGDKGFKSPDCWLSLEETKEFLDSLFGLYPGHNFLEKQDQDIWGCYQIALKYAGYLSSSLCMIVDRFVSESLLEEMEGEKL